MLSGSFSCKPLVGINLWRKSVGVEPTRDVVRLSLDLKSRRPTRVRSSSKLFATF